MNHLIRTTAVAIVMGVCGASLASAQTQQSARVPAAQRALSNILSKYTKPYEAAFSNAVLQRKIASAFHKEFCDAIPRGRVSGWIADVKSVDDDTPNKGIKLELWVQTDSFKGLLWEVLELGNYYPNGAYGDENMQPHSPTIFPVGSPLYNTASTLVDGDTVVFGGTFVPFTSAQACYDNIHYFSLFHFSSIRKIGRGLTLE
jgi:hypothetical protein